MSLCSYFPSNHSKYLQLSVPLKNIMSKKLLIIFTNLTPKLTVLKKFTSFAYISEAVRDISKISTDSSSACSLLSPTENGTVKKNIHKFENTVTLKYIFYKHKKVGIRV